MKILFVSIGGPPKTNAESLQVSHVMKAMIEKGGIEITWLTEKLESRSKGWQMVSSNYAELPSKLNVIELKTGGELLRRIKSKILKPNSFPDDKGYLLKSLTKNLVSKILETKYDLIYSRSSPVTSHALALMLKKTSGLPWVGHFSDPWAWSPLFEKDINRQEFEKELIKNMDSVYVTNQRSRDLMKLKYPFKKIDLFYNVFSEIKEPKSKSHSRYKIMHAGNFYKSRSPECILKTIEKLSTKLSKRVELHFIGFMDPEHKMAVDNFNSKFKIISHGGMPYEEAMEMQLSADLLISIDPVLDDDDSVFLPSKLVEYMSMKIPIVAFCRKSSPSYDLVNEKYGYCFDFDEIHHATKIIGQRITSWEKGETLKLDIPNMEYSARHQVKLLIDQFKGII